jgi:DNA-binding GntR family transcriptional regulator
MATSAETADALGRGALPRLDSRQTRTEEVVDILRASIVDGSLEPGSIHSVGALAGALGVSRTPVREALIRLSTRGMVRFERNRGVRILEMSEVDLQEIFELRRLLEVPGAVNAVAKVTPDGIASLRAIIDAQERAAVDGDERELWQLDRAFHRGVLLMGGNRRLADYVDHLRDVVAVRSMESARSAHREGGGSVDHRGILDRLERRDADGVADAILSHLDGTLELLLRRSPGSRAPE